MNNKAEVLLIDDDEDALLSLNRILKPLLPNTALNATTKEEIALKLLDETSPAVVVMDLCIDEKRGPDSGFDLLKNISKVSPTSRIIVLTGYGSIESGVKCLELGAANFLEKPPDPNHLAALIKDGISQNNLKKAYFNLKESSADFVSQMIVGDSPAARKIKDEIRYAAQTGQPVLITGETGTGKGLCALAIHKLSRRTNKKFVRYQPTFGTGEIAGSELFGHWKGAFTGADNARTGLIEEAHGGTLFLDEVDELSPELQVTLLGVFQDKKVRRLGGNSEFEADFRLITATNQNIEDKVQEKKVRADFYHRIGHLQIHLPPLRERMEDIKIISEAKIKSLSEREDVRVLGLTDEAADKLNTHSWPGNIRELEATIEGAAYRAQYRGANLIDAHDIALKGSMTSNTLSSSSKNFQEQVEDFKIKLLESALKKHEGNQVKAAKELGMERSTLRRILERNR